jgi:membrane dipeptidase
MEAVAASGRIAGIIGVEGGHALEGNVGRLEQWWEAGIRLLTITWCNSNELADGGWDDSQPHGGLSAVGRAAVAEMNRLGMIVDVSHCSQPAFWQILEASAAPVVASHSGVRALCDHPRNLTDLQLRALAQQGGMMGMVSLPAFLKPEPLPTSVADVIAGIDHVVQLVGPEHVGLGSDWDGFGAGPAGLEDVSRLPAVTEGLSGLGYPEAGIELILGRNFLRVWSAIYSARAA